MKINVVIVKINIVIVIVLGKPMLSNWRLNLYFNPFCYSASILFAIALKLFSQLIFTALRGVTIYLLLLHQAL